MESDSEIARLLVQSPAYQRILSEANDGRTTARLHALDEFSLSLMYRSATEHADKLAE